MYPLKSSKFKFMKQDILDLENKMQISLNAKKFNQIFKNYNCKYLYNGRNFPSQQEKTMWRNLEIYPLAGFVRLGQ